jgi:hypothetical protein
MDQEAFFSFKDQVEEDSTRADRWPTVIATMIGLEVNSLRVEASGHFNVQSYIGLEDKPGAGYDQISYKVVLDAPEATPEQIAYLTERCERSSPVGDTLARKVAMTLEFT